MNMQEMLPPKHVFAPGTEEFKKAIKHGKLHLSLPQPPLSIGEDEEEHSPTLEGSPTTQVINISTFVSPLVVPRKLAMEQEDSQRDAHNSAIPTTTNGVLVERNAIDSTTNDMAPAALCRKRKLTLGPNATMEKTRFKDIVGHGAVKVRIDEVLLPLALPKSVIETVLTGVRAQPTSILLHGPPGTGKTKLARAIAGQAQAAFISVAPSDILSKYVGESEASVRQIFEEAWEQASQLESKCAVLFFDEIDALGQSREEGGQSSGGGEGGGCSRRVLAELLMQLNIIGDPKSRQGMQCEDEEDENGHAFVSATAKIIVVAATNRPQDCDSALLRRFGVRLHVGLPTKRDRKKLIRRLLSGVNHVVTNQEIEDLAEDTEGWSGSDLEGLTREAAMTPVRECIRSSALLRKREAKQSGGVASGQDGDQRLDPDTEAREFLMASFRILRPVSIKDFESAIDFWLCNDQNMGSSGTTSGKSQKEYDSSSDEED